MGAQQTSALTAANDDFVPSLTDAATCTKGSSAQKVDFAKSGFLSKPQVVIAARPREKRPSANLEHMDYAIAVRNLVGTQLEGWEEKMETKTLPKPAPRVIKSVWSDR